MPESTTKNSGQFIKNFNAIAKYRHRYEVFKDFVTMTAISLHNVVNKVEALEQEYLQIVSKYSKDEVMGICGLLGELINLLDPEPRDVLGGLYMELELGNSHTGQFFTPPELSQMMAQMLYGDELKHLQKPFITLSEPACGAGGMVLAFVKVMLEHGHNPSEKLWVQCIDVDRTAALMCYIQLTLWNVPAEVIIGNTLSMQFQEQLFTPAHYLGAWDERLRYEELLRMFFTLDTSRASENKPPEIKMRPVEPVSFENGQIGFDF